MEVNSNQTNDCGDKNDKKLHKAIEEIKFYKNKVETEQIPEFKLSRKISFLWIPRYENNILALVYLGAAFLVIVLGLRGLGSQIPNAFSFLCDPITHRLKSEIILVALVGEFLMICLLAITMWYKVEDNKGVFERILPPEPGGLSPDISYLKNALEEIIAKLERKPEYTGDLPSMDEAVSKFNHELNHAVKKINHDYEVLKKIQEELAKLK